MNNSDIYWFHYVGDEMVCVGNKFPKNYNGFSLYRLINEKLYWLWNNKPLENPYHDRAEKAYQIYKREQKLKNILKIIEK